MLQACILLLESVQRCLVRATSPRIKFGSGLTADRGLYRLDGRADEVTSRIDSIATVDDDLRCRSLEPGRCDQQEARNKTPTARTSSDSVRSPTLNLSSVHLNFFFGVTWIRKSLIILLINIRRRTARGSHCAAIADGPTTLSIKPPSRHNVGTSWPGPTHPLPRQPTNLFTPNAMHQLAHDGTCIFKTAQRHRQPSFWALQFTNPPEQQQQHWQQRLHFL